jgi:hypothetical protein
MFKTRYAILVKGSLENGGYNNIVRMFTAT